MQDILNVIKDAGGTCYRVGGFVRDHILGMESKDIDIEVFGLEAEKLYNILSAFGKTDLTGKSFGVFKINYMGVDYDFSLPRRESKTGIGHRDFDVVPDPSMTLEEAAGRRDFTCNSISIDCDGNIHDPYDGVMDLHVGILRATTDHYMEDSLRVSRGVQFCSRFNLRADDRTIYLSRLMLEEARALPVERVKEEWLKWTKGSWPKNGLDFLEDSGHIQLYPQLDTLRFVPQDPIYHPEGNVWVHTKHVCQAMAKICDKEDISGYRRSMLLFSALFHDIGKQYTTVMKKDRWASPAHDKAGVEPTALYLERYFGIYSMSDVVPMLVQEHMIHIGFNQCKDREKFVKKLAHRLKAAKIEDLVLLIEADMSGRPPLKKHCPDSVLEILRIARDLGVNERAEPAKVMGRDLIDAGLVPGPNFKKLLDHGYKIQMNGLNKDKILRQVLGFAKTLPKEVGKHPNLGGINTQT